MYLLDVILGLGKLEERQQEKGKGAEMLNAKTDFYKTMALDANQHHVSFFLVITGHNCLIQVSIDLFLMGHQFQDVASLGPLSRNSAGACYRYPGTFYAKGEYFQLFFNFVTKLKFYRVNTLFRSSSTC